MTQPYMFEKPLGLRDALPQAQRETSRLETIFQRELLRWGYDFIKTPALEYAETIGRASAIADHRLFKFLDAENHPVVLRPDMTTPIARMAASGLRKQPLPLRLAYTADLYRSQRREGGHPSEFEQTGAELIGDATPYADAEVISLMMTLLEKSGLGLVRLAVGHVGFVNAFLHDLVKDKEAAVRLRALLYSKNDVGFHHAITALDLPDRAAEQLHQFIDSRRMGNRETLNFLAGLSAAAEAPLADYYDSIAALYQLLTRNLPESQIDLDVTLVPHLNYYTGFVFQGFGGRLGFPVASGGRYDDLLEKFNRPCPATGFGIRLDRLMSAIPHPEHAAAAEKSVVVYDRTHADAAMCFAAKEREKGRPVVLQHADGVKDMQAYIQQFAAVHYFLEGTETDE